MNRAEDDNPQRAEVAESAIAPRETEAPAQAPDLPADGLLILPVRNVILFPGLVAPITIGRPGSIAAAQEAIRHELQIGVLLQRDGTQDEPGPDDLWRVGTAARVVRYVTTPDGAHHVVCRGVQRVRIKDILTGKPYLVARVERVDEGEEAGAEFEARLARLKERASELFELLPGVSPELPGMIQGFASGGALADFLASLLDIKLEEKQAVLETFDPAARVDRLLVLLGGQVDRLGV